MRPGSRGLTTGEAPATGGGRAVAVGAEALGCGRATNSDVSSVDDVINDGIRMGTNGILVM